MTTLGFAILGLLARESLSGYDLTQRMKGRVGFFWGAGHSQIYPELARLEEGGFVTHSVVEQRERPDKKVFEITERGLEALKGWATEPPPRKPPKDELTLKAYSVWLADGAEAAKLFSDEGRRHEEQLARYEEIRDWMERGVGRRRPPAGLAALRLLRGVAARHPLREGQRRVVPMVGGGRRREAGGGGQARETRRGEREGQGGGLILPGRFR
jgi:DNA-binding PadR family transcriptional regulator